MGANDVAVLRAGNGADDRPTFACGGLRPTGSGSDVWRPAQDATSGEYDRSGWNGSSQRPLKWQRPVWKDGPYC